MNGATSTQYAPRYTDSPSPSIQSANSLHKTTLGKPLAPRQVSRLQSDSHGSLPSRQQQIESENPYGFGGSHDRLASQRSHSPASSQGGRQTPTREAEFRSTPPYEANNSYHSVPGDRPNGDPYNNIPHIDESGYGHMAPRGDDPYHDARPQSENPYGRVGAGTAPEEPHRTHTPIGPYGDNDPYGSASRLPEANLYDSRLSEQTPSQQLYDSRAGAPEHPLYAPEYAGDRVPALHDSSDPFYDRRQAGSPFDDPRAAAGYAGSEQNYEPNYEQNRPDLDNLGYEPSSPYSKDSPYDYTDPMRAPHEQNSPYTHEKVPYDVSLSQSQPYEQSSPYTSFQGNTSVQDPEPVYGRNPANEDYQHQPRGPSPAIYDPEPEQRDNRSPFPGQQLYSPHDVSGQQPQLGIPGGDYDQRSLSNHSQDNRGIPLPFPDKKWRNPELPEVIDYLSHPSNAIKANAAAYLQHLCYMDDDTKAKARTLGGIPALVELVNNDIPEVHRAACGALRNLSYGKANDDNKRAIKNAGGIPALVRLLRKSPDNDVRELVTGILWNLSSCQDLKKNIIDDGLAVLNSNVLIPHSGWDRSINDQEKWPREIYWATVLRNATGVLRNVSSAGEYARKKLRECEGLVDTLFFIIKSAIGKADIDCKSVENCVCVVRNLSYACQEIQDPAYITRRRQQQRPAKGENSGCFGGGKQKKKDVKNGGPEKPGQRPVRPGGPASGMDLLWQPEVVLVYLPLLSDCSNPETLEAAAGAIQNLAACDWQPAEDIRAAVRKERGLPIIVELLTIEADSVVCAAATALRNLSIDTRNKELIGKYAMQQLVAKLPSETKTSEFLVSDDTITAVQATIYEVIKQNSDFAQSLLSEGGVERLVYINTARGRFSPKVVKFASSTLFTLWGFTELRGEYKAKGFQQKDFISTTMAARGGPSPNENTTLNRPRADLGGGGVMQTPPNNRHQHTNNTGPHNNHNYNNYAGSNGRHHESIALNSMGPPPQPNLPSPGYTTDTHSQHSQHNHMPPSPRADYPPPGGVPLFPNLPPSSQQPQPQVDQREPLYAQVNKSGKRRDGQLPGAGGDGGADSWV